MPTFGTTSSSGTSGGSGQSGLMVATKYTLSENGTVETLHTYASANGSSKGAIYSDSGGAPNTRVANCSTSTSIISGQWNTLTLDSPTSLSAGTYWIAILDNTNGMRHYKAGGSNQTAYISATYSSGCPSSFGSPAYQNNDHICYATYNTGAPSTGGFLGYFFSIFFPAIVSSGILMDIMNRSDDCERSEGGIILSWEKQLDQIFGPAFGAKLMMA